MELVTSKIGDLVDPDRYMWNRALAEVERIRHDLRGHQGSSRSPAYYSASGDRLVTILETFHGEVTHIHLIEVTQRLTVKVTSWIGTEGKVRE